MKNEESCDALSQNKNQKEKKISRKRKLIFGQVFARNISQAVKLINYSKWSFVQIDQKTNKMDQKPKRNNNNKNKTPTTKPHKTKDKQKTPKRNKRKKTKSTQNQNKSKV